MQTVCIQVGNTDNQLTQQEWHAFTSALSRTVHAYAAVHFYAPSPGDAPWQNACWVCVPHGATEAAHLRREIIDLRDLFRQSSVAWLAGEVEFI